MKILTFGTIVLSLLMASCASVQNSTTGWDSNVGGNNSTTSAYYSNPGQKIIHSSSFVLTVKNPDTANVYITNIAKRFNGYVREIGTTKTIIRIESKYLDSALNMTGDLGVVSDRSISGKDVTESYSDYKIRLDNAEKARNRYLQLLEKAENVTAALLVEKELERLNQTIELMKGKMNRIDHLVQYSTITIYLKEKKKPGIIGYVGIGVFKAVKWLFVRN